MQTGGLLCVRSVLWFRFMWLNDYDLPFCIEITDKQTINTEIQFQAQAWKDLGL